MPKGPVHIGVCTAAHVQAPVVHALQLTPFDLPPGPSCPRHCPPDLPLPRPASKRRARELLDAADAAVPLPDARGREMLAAAARAADAAEAFAAAEAARAGGGGGRGYAFGSGSFSSGAGAWLGSSGVEPIKR